MTCSPCSPEAKAQGQGAGGGGSAPFVPDPTLLSSLLVPVAVTDAALNTITLLALPANTLATDGDILRLTFSGTLLQSNVAAQTWFVGIQVGGTPLWGAVSAAYAQSAVVRAFEVSCDIKRRAVNSATLGGRASFNNSLVAATAGLGNIAVAPQGGPIGSAVVDPAVNWAAIQNVDIVVQASVAGINFTLRNATLQHLSTVP
jgi:hypothetical protein